MELIDFGPWRFAANPEATRRAYETIGDAQPKPCTCDGCKNLRLVRDQLYPPEILALYRQLGIPAGREPEVYWQGDVDGHLQPYAGFTHFVGHIVTDRPDSMYRVNERFECFFCKGCFLIPEALQPYPLVQFEFSTWLPWVLDVPPEQGTGPLRVRVNPPTRNDV